MGIKNIYSVVGITHDQCKDWLLHKHYAHRIPAISFAYGLYSIDTNTCEGICTFGYPPNYEYNDGKCVFVTFKCLVLELNRLIINDNLPTNSLSFFVTQCLKLLSPRPLCIVSYSDPNHGHHGYIYQATNWIYTGTSTPKIEYQLESGCTFDIRRGIDRKGNIIAKRKLLPTHRYIMLLGDKRQVKQMKSDLKLHIFPYPKGDNRRYDASYQPATQRLLI